MKRTILIAVLATACQQETAQMTQGTPPGANPSTQTVANTATLGRDPIAGSATGDQAVQLIEYEIRMPQTIPAGRRAFHVVNAGKEVHSFEIEGNGVHVRLPSDLSAGSESHYAVDLKPGTYTVYCPVKDHKQRGMSTTLTVQ